VAVDKYGDVFVANPCTSTVSEIVAVNGSIPASPTIKPVGSGFNQPYSVAVDGSGNVYVADYGNDAVKEIVSVSGSVSSSSTVITLAGPSDFSGPDTPGQVAGPAGIALDGKGDVFVTNFINQVSGVTNAIQEIVATDGSVSPSSTVIQLATGYGFAYPEGVAVDASGNVIVADYDNEKVEEIEAVGGNVSAASSVIVLAQNTGNFYKPDSVAIDTNGDVFVADSLNNEVKEIVAVNGSVSATSMVNILAPTTADFNQPNGVAVDGSGDVFVADTFNNAVKEIKTAAASFATTEGGAASTLTVPFTFNESATISAPVVLTQGAPNLDFTDAETGSCTTNGPQTYNAGDTCTVDVTFTPKSPGPRYGAVELLSSTGTVIATGYVYGYGTEPEINFLPGTLSTLGSGFYQPGAVAVDASGDVFVADTFNDAIKELVAVGGSIPASPVIRTLSSSFLQPYGVAVDGSGNVFVADYGNGEVKEVVAVGGVIPSSNPTINVLGSGFSKPAGVGVDANGNVYVADFNNNAVKEILAVGGYTTVRSLSSGFLSPDDVVVDGSGNVFVADTGHSAVKEIVAVDGSIPASPTVNTLGSGFVNPSSVAVDGNGNVFVADTGNRLVKEIMAVNGGIPANNPTINVVGGGFVLPNSVAMSGNGNLFVADPGKITGTNIGEIEELDYADAPTLTFATATNNGSTDETDGALSVQILNNGNAPLTALAPGFSVSPDFMQVDGSGTSEDCTASFSLAAGASCNLSVEFAPIAPANGIVNGSVTLTDNNLYATPSAAQTISLVGTAAEILTLTPSSLPGATVGVPYNQTLTASGGSGTYTYSVSAGTLPAGFSLSSSGALSGMPTVSGAFSFAVTVTDSNNSALMGSQSYSLTVDEGTATLSFAATPAETYGDPPFMVSASSASTGAITYSVINGPATINPSTGVVALTGAGPLTLEATQAAAGGYGSATVNETINIAKQHSLTIVDTSVSSANPSQSITLTATVTAMIAGTPAGPTGTVTFFDNGVPLGSTVQIAGGSAQLVVPGLAAQTTVVITARYSGDGNFFGSTSSNSAPVGVVPYRFTFTNTGTTEYAADAGAAATYNFAVTPLYGSYAGPVSFSVAGLPMGATATFTPNLVAASGGATPITMTVQTSATVAQNHSSGLSGRGIALALLLLPLGMKRNIRKRMKGKMLLLLLLLAGTTAGVTGCGSNSSSSLQSPQVYTLTVTATSGTLTRNQEVTLTIQQR
jgi:sugar lactone lactonase YvrE